MKIALAQTNPIIGDIAGNTAKIHQAIESAGEVGVHLVVFPELAVIGYPPKDLLLKPAVIDHCRGAVADLAAACTQVAAIIGYPRPTQDTQGLGLHNALAFCAGGQMAGAAVKSLLPAYDVFDERRYFEPGPVADPIDFEGHRLGLTICEDLWNDRELFENHLYHSDPAQSLAAAGATVLINCSASPFVEGKHAFRLDLFSRIARRFGVVLLYCNQVGGNDELIFDGNSCAIGADGKVIAHARDFEQDMLVVEIDSAARPANRVETPRDRIESVYEALVLGLGDYCRKCGFDSVVVGLSGGIDSAVTAALCTAALGPEQVRGVAMPSRYSSAHSLEDARELAGRLGIRFDLVPIEPAHGAFETMLAPVFAGRDPDVTEENIQARIRGVIMMAQSNKFGSLLVSTGNKSELAVGYCTLYGDMCGGLAILSDVPKTMVWSLARWINDAAASRLRATCGGPVIPESSITKPPSAELRPDQTDQDSLPPYEQLDRIIELYVEQEQSAGAIIDRTGFDAQTVLRVVRLIDLNEYKRKQAAPGLKVTGRAFGFGRRMPIAQGYNNSVRVGTK